MDTTTATQRNTQSLSILYLRCSSYTSSRGATAYTISLSILYLRCPGRIAVQTRLAEADAFNSLFEMLAIANLIRHLDVYRYFSFQFSI